MGANTATIMNAAKFYEFWNALFLILFIATN